MRAILLTIPLIAGVAAPAYAACGALMKVSCLQDLGASNAMTMVGECGKQLDAYRQCLAKAAADSRAEPRPSPNTPGCGDQRAQRLWEEARLSESCITLKRFRDACPSAPEAALAKGAMQSMGCRRGDFDAPSGVAARGRPQDLRSDRRTAFRDGPRGDDADSAGGVGPYDGVWIARIRNYGVCGKRGGRVVLKIAGGRVTGKAGDGRDYTGTVSPGGEIAFSGPNFRRTRMNHFAGALRDDFGEGRRVRVRGDCRSDLTFSRL